MPFVQIYKNNMEVRAVEADPGSRRTNTTRPLIPDTVGFHFYVSNRYIF